MKCSARHHCARHARLTFLLSMLATLALQAQVVINEIMYHPASHDPREEFIELLNSEPTNVNVGGWSIAGGVNFLIPSNTVVAANGYLVIAGDLARFQALYPGVPNVVGGFVVMRTTNLFGNTITNWDNLLSNSRNAVELENAAGQRIDFVQYADEGEWAQRRRGVLDLNHRGWTWFAAHDGFGRSLELMNSALPNDHGQNWGASQTFGGSPGAANTMASANIAPMILEVAHFPVVPRSTNSVSVTARLLNETASGVTAELHWRVDAATPPQFSVTNMFDDGAHGDGLANDGVFAVTLPAQPNNTVVEFYIYASDGQGNTRAYPAPALPAAGTVGGSPTNAANLLYQVDDDPLNDFGGVPSQQQVLKIIMTEVERAEMQAIPNINPDRQTDAEMNATFIYLDGQSSEVRYQSGVRNRGNSSRAANPPNYRVSYPGDRPLHGVSAININSVQPALQVFSSTLAIRSGAVGEYSRAVQLRVNNQNRATTGQSGQAMFGSYALNEAFTSDWAETHFPSDSGGNQYRAQRNIDPSEFDYRGESPSSYANTYLKESHVSEDDWRDLIVMHSVMGLNGVVPFTTENARQVINPEQWLTHVAVMSLLGNSESGLNSGHNDDYAMYRGVNDPRFILVFHDLDQLFGLGGQAFPDGPNDTIWGATYIQSTTVVSTRSTDDNDGSGNMMDRFMHWPDFEPLYYTTLQRLLDTTFSKPQFDALLEQTLGAHVPPRS